MPAAGRPLPAARPARRRPAARPRPASARCPTSRRRTTGSAATSSSTSGSPARRRRARGRPGLRRGLRLRRAGPQRASRGRRRRQPRGARARAPALPRPNLRFERNMVEPFAEPCDAVVFLQTIEHVPGPRRVLEHFKGMLQRRRVAYVSTPNVLTLAPKGAERSGNPWHLKRVPRRGVPRAVRGALRRRSSCSASSTRASCAPHELALERGWDRRPPALRLTTPFYDRFTPAIVDARLRPALRATRPRPRAGLPGRAAA